MTDSDGVPESTRKPLPSRRTGYWQRAVIGGKEVIIRTGEYTNGQLGEVFIEVDAKEGSTLRALIKCLSMSISIGLQHGVPLREFVDAFVHTNFPPNGLVDGHPVLKTASSILDYIFRELAIIYEGRTDLAHVEICLPTDVGPGEKGMAQDINAQKSAE